MFTIRLHPIDTSESLILDDLTYVVSAMRFGTQLHGGYAACEIKVGSAFWPAYRYLEDMLLHRIVVSEAGETYYEGRIAGVDVEPGQVTVSCEGYWGHGQDAFMDLIYPSRGSNLVQNPSLEEGSFPGPDYWYWIEDDGSGEIDDETTVVADGEHAAKMTGGGGTRPSMYQNVTVESGEKYELLFYTRGDGTYQGQYAIDDLLNGWILSATDTGVTEAAYNLVQYEFTATGTTSIRIYLYGPSANGGICYFDRITLRKVLETTITDVINDAIDLAPQWNSSKAYIDTDNLGTLVINSGGDGLDYDLDWHLNEVIEDALKFGTNETPPRPLYFAVWENRICYMFPRPLMRSENIKWDVHMSDLAGGQQGLVTGRDATKFGNKIAAVYSSGQGERTMTSEVTDDTSIAQYGTVQKRLAISGSLEGIAEAFRDIALEENRVPKQSISIQLDSYVWRGCCPVPVYNVRAGDLIRLHIDPRAVLSSKANYDVSEDWQVRVLFVTATEYDTATNRMSLSLETTTTTLDLLVAWIGLQGARLF